MKKSVSVSYRTISGGLPDMDFESQKKEWEKVSQKMYL